MTSYLGIFNLNKEFVYFIEIRMESSKNPCDTIATIYSKFKRTVISHFSKYRLCFCSFHARPFRFTSSLVYELLYAKIKYRESSAFWAFLYEK